MKLPAPSGWYRAPRQTVRGLLAAPPSEGRLLAMAVAAGLAGFLAQLPRLPAQAAAAGREVAGSEAVAALAAGQLLSSLFLFPLFVYAVAAILHLLSRMFGGQGSFFSARTAVVWTVFATIPITLGWAAVTVLAALLGLPLAWWLSLPLLAFFLWLLAQHLAEAEGFGP